jgi:hypothetical protein
MEKNKRDLISIIFNKISHFLINNSIYAAAQYPQNKSSLNETKLVHSIIVQS